MSRYQSESFEAQTLTIDGNEYHNCTFTRCMLTYTGGELPVMVDNTINSCQWNFDGHAARTIQFMAGLYQGGMRDVIEQTFENIRSAQNKDT